MAESSANIYVEPSAWYTDSDLACSTASRISTRQKQPNS